MKTPAHRLKEARSRAGYRSARQFALKNGFEEGTYRSHENGQRGIPSHAAKQYAATLNVSASWILFGTESPDGTKYDYPGKSGGLSDADYKGTAPRPEAMTQMQRMQRILDDFTHLSTAMQSATIQALLAAQEETQKKSGSGKGRANGNGAD